MAQLLLVFSDKPLAAVNVNPRVVVRCPAKGRILAKPVDPMTFAELESFNPGRGETIWSACSEAGEVVEGFYSLAGDWESFQVVKYWMGDERNPEYLGMLLLANVKREVRVVRVDEGGRGHGAIVDKWAGLSLSYLGDEVYAFDSERLTGLGVIDYPKERRLRVILPPDFVSEKVAASFIRVRTRFPSIDLLDLYLTSLGGNVVGDAVLEVVELPQPDRVKLMAPFAAARLFSSIGWVYYAGVNLDSLEMETRVLVKGGALNIDPGTLAGAVLGFLGGCALGARLGATIGTAFQPGVGTAVGAAAGCVAAGLASAGVGAEIAKTFEEFIEGILGGASPASIVEEVKPRIIEEIEDAKQKIHQQVEDAKRVATKYYERGDLSREAYLKLMQKLNAIEETVDTELDEMQDRWVKTLEDVAKAASKTSLKDLALVGGGAFLAGIGVAVLLTRR